MRIRKYLSVAKISVTERFHHLGNLAGRALVVVFRIWIFTALYRATYRSIGATSINGIDVTGVIWMLAFTQLFRQSAWPSISGLVDDEVKSGSLAYSINRPYSYEVFHFASYVGRIGPNLLVNVSTACMAALIFVGPLHLTVMSVIAGAVLLALSYILDFLFNFSIGMLAFWIEDTTAIAWIYFKGQLIFGGLILPLTLFPSGLRAVGERLPFAAMYYSASRLLVKYDPELFAQYALTQLLWIAVSGILSIALFRKGMKNVELNGG